MKDADCHACGKKGHITPACRSKPQNKSVPPVSRPKTRYHDTHLVQHEKNDTMDSESEEYHLFKLNEPSSNPIEATVNVEDKPLTMELDTGAAVSIISEATRREMFPKKKLHKSKLTLKTYTDEPMQIIGQLNVHVESNGQTSPLVLVVVAGDGPSLFGRNYIRLDWSRIATVRARSSGLQTLLQTHESLFKEELGTVQPRKATLHVKTDATPFAIKDAIGQELDRLEKQGTIRKVDWAAAIVAVPKKDGRFRRCGDYKVTINQALIVDQYPLPKPEDLFGYMSFNSS